MSNSTFNLEQTTIKKLLTTYKLQIPDFQRSYVWKLPKKQQLLQSLYKGFPIGVITLYENEGGYYIIDGLQRINTLKNYLTRPAEIVYFNDFYEKIEDKIFVLLNSHNCRYNSRKVRRAVKGWYESLDEMYLYERVSVLFKKLKESCGEIFDEPEKELDLAEEILNLLKEAIEIKYDEIALIIYRGERENLPELFKNINTGSVALSQYEILQAIWINYKLSSDILKEEYSYFLNALKLISDEYEIEALKEKGEFDIFKSIIGLNLKICCIEKAKVIFGSSIKEIKPDNRVNPAKYYENDSLGFEIYSTLIMNAPNKIVKAIDKIFSSKDDVNTRSTFFADMNKAIFDSITYAIGKIEEREEEPTFTSRYHSLFVVSGIILANYKIDTTNMLITKTEKNQEIEKICLDFEKHKSEEWFTGKNRQISFYSGKISDLLEKIV